MIFLPFLQRATTLVTSYLLPRRQNSSKNESAFYPLYTGGFFPCYILDKIIYHLRSVRYIFVAFILFLMEKPVSKHCLPNNVDPDQMPHYVASDLELHCLRMALGKNRLKERIRSYRSKLYLKSRSPLGRVSKMKVVELLPLKIYSFPLN